MPTPAPSMLPTGGPIPSPTFAPSAVPAPAPTPLPTTNAVCEDSTSWHYKKTSRDCEWIGEKTSRCDGKEDAFGVSARDACRLSCGECEPVCEDSSSWYKKKNKGDDCAWVAKDPDARCSSKSKDNVKAKDACQQTCGTCGEEDRRFLRSSLRGAN